MSLRFEPVSRRLWILDQEVALDDANAVMVDGVDDPSGLRVVGTLRIDPAFDTATDVLPGVPPGASVTRRRSDVVPAQTFIRRSPELVWFLQCDARPPTASEYEQKVFEMWCATATSP